MILIHAEAVLKSLKMLTFGIRSCLLSQVLRKWPHTPRPSMFQLPLMPCCMLRLRFVSPITILYLQAFSPLLPSGVDFLIFKSSPKCKSPMKYTWRCPWESLGLQKMKCCSAKRRMVIASVVSLATQIEPFDDTHVDAIHQQQLLTFFSPSSSRMKTVSFSFEQHALQCERY